jgi:hypothetical protein
VVVIGAVTIAVGTRLAAVDRRGSPVEVGLVVAALVGERALVPEWVAVPAPVEPDNPVPAVDFVEREMPVEPALEPVLLLDDEAPSAEGAAWATPVAPASEAQNPIVTAPVPSQMDTSLRRCSARWRTAVRFALPFIRLAARCLAATLVPVLLSPSLAS